MSVWSRDLALIFAHFDFLSKDLYNDIYVLGVLNNFENQTESLYTIGDLFRLLIMYEK